MCELKKDHQSIENMKAQITIIESELIMLKSSAQSADASMKELSLFNLYRSSTIRSPDALAAEIQDRLRRSQNIILYKVPEPQLAVDLWDHQRRSATEAPTHSNDLEDLPSRSATEAPTLSNNLEYIRNLLAKINNIDLTQLKVRRLHSENNKGGHIPVLVRLQSSLR